MLSNVGLILPGLLYVVYMYSICVYAYTYTFGVVMAMSDSRCYSAWIIRALARNYFVIKLAKKPTFVRVHCSSVIEANEKIDDVGARDDFRTRCASLYSPMTNPPMGRGDSSRGGDGVNLDDYLGRYDHVFKERDYECSILVKDSAAEEKLHTSIPIQIRLGKYSISETSFINCTLWYNNNNNQNDSPREYAERAARSKPYLISMFVKNIMDDDYLYGLDGTKRIMA